MMHSFDILVKVNNINENNISNKIVSITILTALLITGFIIIQPFYIHAQKETATNIPDTIKVTKCQVVNPPTDPI